MKNKSFLIIFMIALSIFSPFITQVALFNLPIVFGSGFAPPTIQYSKISNMDDTQNLYATKRYYNFTTVISNSPAQNITMVNIKFDNSSGANIGFFELDLNYNQVVLNGNFEDVFILTDWTGNGVGDNAHHHTGTASADLSSNHNIKQLWGSDTSPFAGGVAVTSITNFGFWFEGNATGGSNKRWCVVYVAHTGDVTAESYIEYLPDTACTWTYWDALAPLVAYDPTVLTDPNCTILGIYFAQNTNVAETWIDDVVCSTFTTSWINYNPVDWNLNTTASSWKFTTVGGIASFFVEPTWKVKQFDNVSIATSVLGNGVNSTWGVLPSYCNVISRLVLNNYVGNATKVSGSSWLKLTGSVRYATSAIGNTPSPTYPNDNQFTYISTKDQFGTTWATDPTIHNGIFSLTFPVNGISQSQFFYIYLKMVSPFVSGLTVDGRYWQISLVASNTPDIWSQIFNWLGINNYAVEIGNAITSFATYFVDSLKYYVSLTLTTVAFLLSIVASIAYWFTLLITTVSSLLTLIGSILSGGYGFINFFGIFINTTTAPFLVIMAIVAWLASLGARALQRGINVLELALADIQTLWWVVSTISGVLYQVFYFVLDLALRFFTAIRG
jgi:hypothetical protein